MAIVCTPSVSAAQQAKGQEHKAAGHTQATENQAGGNPFWALLQGGEALASTAVELSPSERRSCTVGLFLHFSSIVFIPSGEIFLPRSGLVMY